MREGTNRQINGAARSLSLRLLLVTALCARSILAQDATSSQKGIAIEATIQVTAVEVIVKLPGAKDMRLAPSDFTIIDGRQRWPVIAVEPLFQPSPQTTATAEASHQSAPSPGLPPRIVIYCDLTAASAYSVRHAASALKLELDDLTTKGSVEIVLADPEPQVLLAPTRDPGLIASELEKLVTRSKPLTEFNLLRRMFLQELDPTDDNYTKMLIRQAAAQEHRFITQVQERLLSWATASKSDTPAVMLMLTDGFDLDPAEFYVNRVTSSEAKRELQADMRVFNSAPAIQDTASSLAAQGWVVFSLAPGYLSALTNDASKSGHQVWREFFSNDSSGGSSAPLLLVQHPLDALQAMAQTTGGAVFTDARKMGTFSKHLDGYFRLIYQMSGVSTGRMRKVTVRSNRADLKFSAEKWIGFSTPEVIAGVRARDLLNGISPPEDIPVQCRTTRGARTSKKNVYRVDVNASIDLQRVHPLLKELRSTSVRTTVAVRRSGNPDSVHHRVSDHVDASVKGIQYETSIDLSKDAEAITVIIEELTTGLWGGCRVPVELTMRAGGQ